MTLEARRNARLAGDRRAAAGLIQEARMKEFEAAMWIGHPRNIEEARAHVHSAVDALLDAILNELAAVRAVYSNER